MECAVFVDAGWTASVVPDLPILRRPDLFPAVGQAAVQTPQNCGDSARTRRLAAGIRLNHVKSC